LVCFITVLEHVSPNKKLEATKFPRKFSSDMLEIRNCEQKIVTI